MNNIREARIICPAGHPAAQSTLETSLTAAYGGWTALQALGNWHGTTELVTVYEIGMEETNANASVLRMIARKFCHDAKQECVYIRNTFGHVEFVHRDWAVDETSPPAEGADSAAEHGRRIAERRRVNRPWDENGE